MDKNPEKIGTKDKVSRKYVIQKPEILKDKNKEQIVVLIANKKMWMKLLVNYQKWVLDIIIHYA